MPCVYTLHETIILNYCNCKYLLLLKYTLNKKNCANNYILVFLNSCFPDILYGGLEDRTLVLSHVTNYIKVPKTKIK